MAWGLLVARNSEVRQATQCRPVSRKKSGISAHGPRVFAALANTDALCSYVMALIGSWYVVTAVGTDVFEIGSAPTSSCEIAQVNADLTVVAHRTTLERW
ncbi:hypothetical protein C5B85_03370 [Pseudoclavibacter sp. AY1F1]|nr:hypothetical protein C5B85_03370 [Pseudoclavibacter sp. AY1F1]